MVLDPAGLVDEVRVKDLRLSKSTEQLLPVVAAMPLASVVDYAAVVGKTPSYFYPRLWELRDAGLLSSVSVGATRQKAARWFLTREGMSRLSILSPHWHEESALGRLLERLPMVEWFYQAAVGLPGLGELEQFQLVQRCCVGRCGEVPGWLGRLLLERRDAAGVPGEGDVHEAGGGPGAHHSVLGPDPYPGFLCFVVSDPWQRELVFRVAREFGCTHVLRVWCVSDGTVAGAREPGRSIGWVQQLPVGRDMGGWGWEQRVADSYWARPSASGGTRLLESVAEWPGMTSKFGKELFREAGSSRWVQRLFKSLHQGGLITRDEVGRGSYRYSVCQKGFNVLALRDRVSNSKLPSGVRPLPVPVGHPLSGPRGRRDGAHGGVCGCRLGRSRRVALLGAYGRRGYSPRRPGVCGTQSVRARVALP